MAIYANVVASLLLIADTFWHMNGKGAWTQYRHLHSASYTLSGLKTALLDSTDILPLRICYSRQFTSYLFAYYKLLDDCCFGRVDEQNWWECENARHQFFTCIISSHSIAHINIANAALLLYRCETWDSQTHWEFIKSFGLWFEANWMAVPGPDDVEKTRWMRR